MKITKSKLAQIVQEELSNTMSEAEQWKMGRSMKAADLAADPLYAAENQGIVDAQDDFMRSKRGEEVSPDLPSFGSAEEEEAYGMAWGKEWHRLMDIAAKNAVERKLNRPPEPMTDADREAADAELDFEATYSEGKTKITKSQLATIIKEELGDYPNFSNMESLLSKLLSSIEGLDLSIDYLAGSISGEDAFSAAANQRTFGRYAASQPALKENKMKITKSQLSKIIQEELQAVTTEGMDTLEAHMLGREHAVEVWRGEREDSDIMMMSNAAYRAGFEDATEEIAAEEGEDSLHRDPSHDYEGDSPEEEYDDDWMRENKITKSKLAQIVQEELNNTMLEGLMLEQQNVEKAAELAANMKDTPEVEAIFATLDKDPEAQKALKSILAQLPDENIEEAEDLDPAGGIATTATFLMVGNTMYHVAAGKALMGAVVAAGLPIAGGLTGLALVALAMKYVKNRQRQAKKNSNEEKFKHHVGSKYYQGPAVKERKITKSKLAQIVQEELAAIKAEGYKAYKRDGMSPHAKDMAKNIKKGYSPQAAITAIPDNEKVDKAYYDSLNKKPKRGKKDLEEDLAPYTNLKGYVLQALRDLGGEDVLGDIAHVAGRAWAEDNWNRGDERLSEEGMFYSVKEALESLEVDGRVRLTQGGPDSTDEEVFALVHKEDLDEARG